MELKKDLKTVLSVSQMRYVKDINYTITIIYELNIKTTFIGIQL